MFTALPPDLQLPLHTLVVGGHAPDADSLYTQLTTWGVSFAGVDCCAQMCALRPAYGALSLTVQTGQEKVMNMIYELGAFQGLHLAYYDTLLITCTRGTKVSLSNPKLWTRDEPGFWSPEKLSATSASLRTLMRTPLTFGHTAHDILADTQARIGYAMETPA